jgi:DNA-binding FadR family transcriptional regulator
MHLNLRAQLCDSLGRQIVSGSIKPESSLPHEDELKSSFGVSRTVIREAIRSLAAKGLVTSKPKLGTRVAPSEDWNFLDKDVLLWAMEGDSSGEFFRHLTDLRKSIEPLAAEKVAQSGSDEVLLNIENHFNTMEANVNHMEAYVNADIDFHICILHGANNPLFSPITHVIRHALKHSLERTNRTAEENRRSIPIHRSITQAICSRHPDLARASMFSHFQDLEKRLYPS